jgi:ubiquinone/menaquinone biosynthesis C-methylase UbiE
METDRFSSAFAYGRSKLEVLLNETVQHLPEGGTVLDIGCGTGKHLNWYVQSGFKATGLEPSPEMRAIAQRYNPGAPILDGTADALPFSDQSFDFVSAIEVLRYLHPMDIQKAFREMARVLKPGGRLFVTLVNRYALDGFYPYYAFRNLLSRVARKQQPVHCQFVTPGQVRRDLRGLGFSEIALHGRMFASLRPVYKISSSMGARLARYMDSFDDSLARMKWMAPFSGHLVVVAVRSQCESPQIGA